MYDYPVFRAFTHNIDNSTFKDSFHSFEQHGLSTFTRVKSVFAEDGNQRWTTKLLLGLMTGPFVRCYRFPPDVTRRWVVRPDFLINSVLVVWTRTRSVCISFIRRIYPFCNRQTEFLFRSLIIIEYSCS